MALSICMQHAYIFYSITCMCNACIRVERSSIYLEIVDEVIEAVGQSSIETKDFYLKSYKTVMSDFIIDLFLINL